MRRTRSRGSPRSSSSRLNASKGDAVMTPPKSKMTWVYRDMARLERRLTLTSIRPRAAISRRSEEHTSELQSLMRISHAVFCLKQKRQLLTHITHVDYSG